MEDAIAEYQANLRNEQAEVAVHKPLVRKRWKTKDGTFQVKRKQVVDDDPSAFFLARSCLGQVPGGAPFSQRSELATACT